MAMPKSTQTICRDPKIHNPSLQMSTFHYCNISYNVVMNNAHDEVLMTMMMMMMMDVLKFIFSVKLLECHPTTNKQSLRCRTPVRWRVVHRSTNHAQGKGI